MMNRDLQKSEKCYRDYRKTNTSQLNREKRNKQRAKDHVRYWLFKDTAFERLNPKE
jgi:hypothetical protein